MGAGPYGLSTAAYAKQSGIDFLIVGEPMGFWKRHMPKGMLLRSGLDWHLDPFGIHTLEAFLDERGIEKAKAQPIPVELFIDYAQWFQERKGLVVQPSFIKELRYQEGFFRARFESGEDLLAENVVAALGFGYFMHVPPEIVADLLPHRYSHTCTLVNFDSLRGRRCLIVGGRQSAFEWAVLMRELGVAEIHLAYRHDTPSFEESHWSWVDPLMEKTLSIPGWFRRLSREDRETINRRFWVEGRLKLEPWLGPRVNQASIKPWPRSRVAGCRETSNGEIAVSLDNGVSLTVDHLVLATGYRLDMKKVPYLSEESILPKLRLADGYPVLDESFQSSIPGLFFPGLAATKDFGLFFGFVRGCPVAARLIVERIKNARQRKSA
jgi:cation diffusion facilitator CzcD-associated flavoprotein CzcO